MAYGTKKQSPGGPTTVSQVLNLTLVNSLTRIVKDHGGVLRQRIDSRASAVQSRADSSEHCSTTQRAIKVRVAHTSFGLTSSDFAIGHTPTHAPWHARPRLFAMILGLALSMRVLARRGGHFGEDLLRVGSQRVHCAVLHPLAVLLELFQGDTAFMSGIRPDSHGDAVECQFGSTRHVADIAWRGGIMDRHVGVLLSRGDGVVLDMTVRSVRHARIESRTSDGSERVVLWQGEGERVTGSRRVERRIDHLDYPVLSARAFKSIVGSCTHYLADGRT